MSNYLQELLPEPPEGANSATYVIHPYHPPPWRCFTWEPCACGSATPTYPVTAGLVWGSAAANS